MTKLIPIKVKIGLRSNGNADHPDWTKMPMIFSDSDMKKYCPLSWMYDKSSGHQEETPDSPRGMQWGFLLGTCEFVDEAISTFPELITEITEAEFIDFYDNRIMAHLPEKNYDIDVLQGLKLELDLKKELNQSVVELNTKIEKAIDPEDASLGVRTNKDKKWSDFKLKVGIEIEKRI